MGGRLRLVYEPRFSPSDDDPLLPWAHYSPLRDRQAQVEVYLYQDPHGTALTPDDAVDTGIVGLDHRHPHHLPGEPHPIEIAFIRY